MSCLSQYLKSMIRQIWVYMALIALVHCHPCTGQNLVPNPSFELYNACPSGISGLEYSPGYITFPTVLSWVNPLQLGSSDYFHSCANSGTYVSVPGNAFGHQSPRTGNGYIGIIAWEGRMQNGSMTSSFAEYIQCKLTQPMVAGSRYCVSFYVNNALSPATYNYVGIDNIGINFSTSKTNQPTGYTMALPASVTNQQGRFLTDTAGWMKVTTSYTASGGEEWLTLGWFNNSAVPAFMPVLPAVPNPTDNYRCYLYIDDMSVLQMSSADTIYTKQDLFLCKNLGRQMQLTSSVQYADYTWSNGATTDNVKITDTGVYWCVASTGCITYIDTFVIRYDATPKLFLGNEIINCENQPVTIHSNYTADIYKWSTGATTPSITVTQTGIYALTINNKCGLQTDSVHVFIQPPTPAPAPADTMICQFVQNPAIQVSGTGISWYTHANGYIGSTYQPLIITREPGSYYLFITQTIGKCESEKAPVKVTVTYTPHEELGDKVVMCENDLKMIGTASHGVDYKWNTGSESCCLLPDREGLYRRASVNECGSFVDSLWVYHTLCEDCITFPNAFTPVKGYNNNIFRPLLKCPVSEFHIRIYNRWGNMVYESTDVYEGWTGRYNFDWAPLGTYVYVAEYKAKDKHQKQRITGNVTLLR